MMLVLEVRGLVNLTIFGLSMLSGPLTPPLFSIFVKIGSCMIVGLNFGILSFSKLWNNSRKLIIKRIKIIYHQTIIICKQKTFISF